MTHQEETFPEREERILQEWRTWHAFPTSVERRQGGPRFSFYDGPPFATGLPHHGHLLAGTLKDVIPRFKTMQGYYVPRRFGWDCHGLPVENEVEKAFQLTGAHTIEAFGIARFNEECRSIVLRYSQEWKATVERMGRWVDFDHPYLTMDPSYMESVWWVFSQLWEKGLVYQGLKVMPFSCKLGTPLSNFEANLNYKEVDDPALTIAMPLVEDPGCSLLIWTTTPWTLPSNLAVVVHPELRYAEVQLEQGARYLVAEERLNAVFGDRPRQILKVLPGHELAGLRYQPPYAFFEKTPFAHQVILGNFVSVEDGTGLVHAAPGFGEDDFYACQQAGIPPVCPVDQNGRFTAEVPPFSVKEVRSCNPAIIQDLKQRGSLFHQATVHHRYPYCWRSDTPLIYKAVNTWFVAVEKIRDRLLAANQKIEWVPHHIKEGRFGKWLEGARDWAVSRNRYWGTPIPIWQSESGKTIVMRSRAELEQLVGHSVPDLHRHFIDDLEVMVDGERYVRVPEVFDCWFESGSMPYAQLHYPFEHQDLFQAAFPADFIAEGLDQTRGWFYTLTVLSVALFDLPAFYNVIVNGIILADNGQKMSKSLKNYTEPALIIRKYGADAIRLYLLSSPATQAEDLAFKDSGVEQTLRQVLIPLWNATHFFTTYAEINQWTAPATPPDHLTEIDRWILSALQDLIHQTTQALEGYQLSQALQPCFIFLDQLTNWYIRRSRRRFWGQLTTPDEVAAFWTLHHVLRTFSQVMAPFIPFLTEAMWQKLRSSQDLQSVHWTDYPEVDAQWFDRGLLEKMSWVRTVVTLGHALRKEHRIKVRQPLSKALVATRDAQVHSKLQQALDLIAEELNVEHVELLLDDSQLVHYKIKPNFRILGKRVGRFMPQFQQLLNQPDLPIEELFTKPLVAGCDYILQNDDVAVEQEVLTGVVAATDQGVTVALETTLTPALIRQGIARELINRINTLRKEQGLLITDRIHLSLTPHPLLEEVVQHYREMIAEDVLAKSIQITPFEVEPIDLNGINVGIFIERCP